MKQILLLLFISISSLAYSQVPNQFNYQAVARNSVGNVLPNKKIMVRLSIREGSGTGTVPAGGDRVRAGGGGRHHRDPGGADVPGRLGADQGGAAAIAEQGVVFDSCGHWVSFR